MKKHWVLSAALVATVLLAGCGAKSQATKKPAGPSATALIKQSVTAQKKQQNLHMKMDVSAEAQGQTMHVIMNGDFNMKPIAFLGDYTLSAAGKSQAMKMYLAKDKMYVTSADQWVDTSSAMASSGINLDTYQKQIDGGSVSNLPKALVKTAKVKKADGQYTITMNADKKLAKQIMKAGASAVPSAMSSTVSDAKVSKITYTYVMNTGDKLPAALNMVIKMKYQGKSMTENVKTSYTNWGKSSVTAPKLK